MKRTLPQRLVTLIHRGAFVNCQWSSVFTRPSLVLQVLFVFPIYFSELKSINHTEGKTVWQNTVGKKQKYKLNQTVTMLHEDVL